MPGPEAWYSKQPTAPYPSRYGRSSASLVAPDAVDLVVAEQAWRELFGHRDDSQIPFLGVENVSLRSAQIFHMIFANGS